MVDWDNEEEVNKYKKEYYKKNRDKLIEKSNAYHKARAERFKQLSDEEQTELLLNYSVNLLQTVEPNKCSLRHINGHKGKTKGIRVKIGKNKCKAVSKAGRKCRYDAILEEYCNTHYRMYVMKQ